MPFTIDHELQNPLITVLQRDDHEGLYEFTVGTLDTVVTVMISRLPGSEECRYERSHDIKTPRMIAPYRQSRGYWDDAAYALHQAIISITSYYEEAVKAGDQPVESRLVSRTG